MKRVLVPGECRLKPRGPTPKQSGFFMLISHAKTLTKLALMLAWERGWIDGATTILWLRRLHLVEA